jgi:hypothetical protein
MSRPRLAAVTEVSAGLRGRVPVVLLEAAYCASRGGTVVLLLNGVSAAQVDHSLDSVVSRVGGVERVEYFTPDSLGQLLQN